MTAPCAPSTRLRLGSLRLGLVTLACVCSLSCAARTDVTRILGGQRAVELVSAPEQVEAWRLGPLPEGTAWRVATVADYPVLAGPVPLAPDQAARLSEVLLRPSTYRSSFAKGCVVQYGVRVSFVAPEARRLDVMFCFECDILTTYLDGEIAGGHDFEAARGDFVRLVRAIFPDDPEIAALSED